MTFLLPSTDVFNVCQLSRLSFTTSLHYEYKLSIFLLIHPLFAFIFKFLHHCFPLYPFPTISCLSGLYFFHIFYFFPSPCCPRALSSRATCFEQFDYPVLVSPMRRDDARFQHKANSDQPHANPDAFQLLPWGAWENAVSWNEILKEKDAF